MTRHPDLRRPKEARSASGSKAVQVYFHSSNSKRNCSWILWSLLRFYYRVITKASFFAELSLSYLQHCKQEGLKVRELIGSYCIFDATAVMRRSVIVLSIRIWLKYSCYHCKENRMFSTVPAPGRVVKRSLNSCLQSVRWERAFELLHGFGKRSLSARRAMSPASGKDGRMGGRSNESTSMRA